MHPVFAAVYGEQEARRDDFLAAMKGFRPATTIFEQGGAKGLGRENTVMRSKRDQDAVRVFFIVRPLHIVSADACFAMQDLAMCMLY